MVIVALVAAVAIVRSFRHDSTPERPPRVVKIENTAVIALPTASQPRLVLAGAYEFDEGQFLTTFPGGNAPEGFLLKVRSSRQSDGRTIVETVPGSLFEAVPQGSLVANPADFGPPPGKGQVTPFALAAFHPGTRTVGDKDGGGLFSFPVGAHLECGQSKQEQEAEELKLDGKFERTIEPVFDMRWKKRRPKARWIESAEAGLRGEVRGTVTASTTSKCEARAEAHVKIPVFVAVVPAGPVPVPIWVEAHGGVEAIAKLESEVKATVGVALSGFAGVEYSDEQLAAVVKIGNEASVKLEVKPLKATATVTVKPGVSIEAGWRAGPLGKLAARAHLGLDVTAEPKYDPKQKPSTQVCFPIALKGRIAFHLPVRRKPVLERTASYPPAKEDPPRKPKCIAVGPKPTEHAG